MITLEAKEARIIADYFKNPDISSILDILIADVNHKILVAMYKGEYEVTFRVSKTKYPNSTDEDLEELVNVLNRFNYTVWCPNDNFLKISWEGK